MMFIRFFGKENKLFRRPWGPLLRRKKENPGTTGKEAQQKPKEEEQVASFRAMGA